MFDSLLLGIKVILSDLKILAITGFGVSLIAASFFSSRLARRGAVFCTVMLLFLLWLDDAITVADKEIDTGYLNVYPFIKTQEHKYYEKQAVISILNIDQPYTPGMKLPIGSYEVEATLEKYETLQITINLSRDQTLNLYLRMRPVLNTQRLDIEATTDAFKAQTEKALNLLKATNNVAYNIATRHMDNIRQITIAGGTQGMLTRYYPGWEAYPTFNVAESSWKSIPNLDDIIWYASVIAHDSYHAKQYDDAEIICRENQTNLSDGLPANWLNENRPERKATIIAQPNFVCSDPDELMWREDAAERGAIDHQISVLSNIAGASNELLYLRLMQQECKGMHFKATNPCAKKASALFLQQIAR